MGRLRKLNQELAAESVVGTRKAEDEKLIIRKNYEDAFAEDRRQSGLETDAVVAGMEERALRRQGKGLESAIQANSEKVKHQVSDLRASVREHELEKLDPADRPAKIADVEAKIIAISKSGREINAELRYEHDRKEQEQARDNGEKLAEIQADGNIERLRIQDENLNARAEKEGRATRSHLAEQAQIQEEYRKQVAGLEKKYREDNRTNDVNRDDPTLKASLAAADEERRQKLGVLEREGRQRGDEEPGGDHLKEQRKLWEQRWGRPAEVRRAHGRHQRALREVPRPELEERRDPEARPGDVRRPEEDEPRPRGAGQPLRPDAARTRTSRWAGAGRTSPKCNST
jgi:hypothetical protein